jgi:predicted esterase
VPRLLVEHASPHWLALLALAACRSHTESDPIGSPVASLAAVDVTNGIPVGASSDEVAAPSVSPSSVHVTTDWCIEELSALDEDVCYVLPRLAQGRPRRLIVYLHGIIPQVPDSVPKRSVQTAVLRASVRAGVAALVPRGRRGVGPAGARDWWAWPTTSRAIAELTPSILARWSAAKAKLEGIVGMPFERTYLAGSSNGAHFLAALVVHADELGDAFPFDGFGAMSGGAFGAAASGELSRIRPRPFYVGFGAYDEESRTNARLLVAALRAAHWPVREAEHPLGHGANEVYLDEAIEFWMAAEGSAPDAER